jgi:hypothetical protein
MTIKEEIENLKLECISLEKTIVDMKKEDPAVKTK